MSKNLNSADRIQKILKQAHQHPGTLMVIEAWALIFQINEEHQTRRAGHVSQLLQAMQRELQMTAQGLAERNYSQDLYEGVFSRIEHVISPMMLPTPWSNVQQQLTADVMISLAFSAEILPHEENEIDQKDLDFIRQQVIDLKQLLSVSEIPQRLRALIAHHIELIENALAEYPIAGAQALREAGRTALGEIIEVREEVASAKGDPAVSKLNNVWQSVNSAADIALKGEKMASLGQRAWETLSNIF